MISVDELLAEASKQGKTLCEDEGCIVKQPHWHPRPQNTWPEDMGSAITQAGLLTYAGYDPADSEK